MGHVQALVDPELSEPYSIFTYRFASMLIVSLVWTDRRARIHRHGPLPSLEQAHACARHSWQHSSSSAGSGSSLCVRP